MGSSCRSLSVVMVKPGQMSATANSARRRRLARQLVCGHPLGLRDQLVQVDEGGPAALYLTQPPPGMHRIRTVSDLGGGQSVG